MLQGYLKQKVLHEAQGIKVYSSSSGAISVIEGNKKVGMLQQVLALTSIGHAWDEGLSNIMPWCNGTTAIL